MNFSKLEGEKVIRNKKNHRHTRTLANRVKIEQREKEENGIEGEREKRSKHTLKKKMVFHNLLTIIVVTVVK